MDNFDDALFIKKNKLPTNKMWLTRRERQRQREMETDQNIALSTHREEKKNHEVNVTTYLVERDLQGIMLVTDEFQLWTISIPKKACDFGTSQLDPRAGSRHRPPGVPIESLP